MVKYIRLFSLIFLDQRYLLGLSKILVAWLKLSFVLAYHLLKELTLLDFLAIVNLRGETQDCYNSFGLAANICYFDSDTSISFDLFWKFIRIEKLALGSNNHYLCLCPKVTSWKLIYVTVTTHFSLTGNFHLPHISFG